MIHCSMRQRADSDSDDTREMLSLHHIAMLQAMVIECRNGHLSWLDTVSSIVA